MHYRKQHHWETWKALFKWQSHNEPVLSRTETSLTPNGRDIVTLQQSPFPSQTFEIQHTKSPQCKPIYHDITVAVYDKMINVLPRLVENMNVKSCWLKESSKSFRRKKRCEEVPLYNTACVFKTNLNKMDIRDCRQKSSTWATIGRHILHHKPWSKLIDKQDDMLTAIDVTFYQRNWIILT